MEFAGLGEDKLNTFISWQKAPELERREAKRTITLASQGNSQEPHNSEFISPLSTQGFMSCDNGDKSISRGGESPTDSAANSPSVQETICTASNSATEEVLHIFEPGEDRCEYYKADLENLEVESFGSDAGVESDDVIGGWDGSSSLREARTEIGSGAGDDCFEAAAARSCSQTEGFHPQIDSQAAWTECSGGGGSDDDVSDDEHNQLFTGQEENSGLTPSVVVAHGRTSRSDGQPQLQDDDASTSSLTESSQTQHKEPAPSCAQQLHQRSTYLGGEKPRSLGNLYDLRTTEKALKELGISQLEEFSLTDLTLTEPTNSFHPTSESHKHTTPSDISIGSATTTPFSSTPKSGGSSGVVFTETSDPGLLDLHNAPGTSVLGVPVKVAEPELEVRGKGFPCKHQSAGSLDCLQTPATSSTTSNPSTSSQLQQGQQTPSSLSCESVAPSSLQGLDTISQLDDLTTNGSSSSSNSLWKTLQRHSEVASATPPAEEKQGQNSLDKQAPTSLNVNSAGSSSTATTTSTPGNQIQLTNCQTGISLASSESENREARRNSDVEHQDSEGEIFVASPQICSTSHGVAEEGSLISERTGSLSPPPPSTQALPKAGITSPLSHTDKEIGAVDSSFKSEENEDRVSEIVRKAVSQFKSVTLPRTLTSKYRRRVLSHEPISTTTSLIAMSVQSPGTMVRTKPKLPLFVGSGESGKGIDGNNEGVDDIMGTINEMGSSDYFSRKYSRRGRSATASPVMSARSAMTSPLSPTSSGANTPIRSRSMRINVRKISAGGGCCPADTMATLRGKAITERLQKLSEASNGNGNGNGTPDRRSPEFKGADQVSPPMGSFSPAYRKTLPMDIHTATVERGPVLSLPGDSCDFYMSTPTNTGVANSPVGLHNSQRKDSNTMEDDVFEQEREQKFIPISMENRMKELRVNVSPPSGNQRVTMATTTVPMVTQSTVPKTTLISVPSISVEKIDPSTTEDEGIVTTDITVPTYSNVYHTITSMPIYSPSKPPISPRSRSISPKMDKLKDAKRETVSFTPQVLVHSDIKDKNAAFLKQFTDTDGTGEVGTKLSNGRFVTHPPIRTRKETREVGSVDSNGLGSLKNEGGERGQEGDLQNVFSQQSIADSQCPSEPADLVTYYDTLAQVTSEATDYDKMERKNGKAKQKSKSDPSGEKNKDNSDLPNVFGGDFSQSVPELLEGKDDVTGLPEFQKATEKEKSKSDTVLSGHSITFNPTIEEEEEEMETEATEPPNTLPFKSNRRSSKKRQRISSSDPVDAIKQAEKIAKTTAPTGSVAVTSKSEDSLAKNTSATDVSPSDAQSDTSRTRRTRDSFSLTIPGSRTKPIARSVSSVGVYRASRKEPSARKGSTISEAFMVATGMRSKADSVSEIGGFQPLGRYSSMDPISQSTLSLSDLGLDNSIPDSDNQVG